MGRVEVITRSSFASNSMHGISNVSLPSCKSPLAVKMWSFDGARSFSAKSMRSKVEKRMQRESGKTLREIRRAKKLRKKLMTDEERLIYNLRRVCCLILLVNRVFRCLRLLVWLLTVVP